MKWFVCAMILILSLYSCEDKYYLLPDSLEDLIPYKQGDSIMFLELPEKDTIVLKVRLYDKYYDNNSFVSWAYYQGLYIEIEGEESYISIYASYNEPTRISLQLRKTQFEGSLNDTLINFKLNDIQYPEIFVVSEVKNERPMLYLAKDLGIVYIDSAVSGDSYELISYVKNQQ